MLMPSIFGENLFDEFDNWMDASFHDVDKALYGKHAKNMMKTDVKETEKGYEVDIDLPGFKKDEIQLELNDGYLTISLDSSELQYMFSIYGELEVGDDVVLVCNRNGSSYTAVDALEY